MLSAMKWAAILAWVALAGAALAGKTPAEAAVGTPPPLVYVIPIRNMIEPALVYVVRRGVTAAHAADARAIILVMDTPGGTLDAADKIIRMIQSSPVPVITFVEKDAYSAGAIIALATREIYMAPGSVIGDAMPILMSPLGGVQEMPEDIQEKMVSGVAAKIRAAAEQGGHDSDLAEAMVRRDMEYKIGDEVIKKDGQLLTLTNEEATRRVGPKKQPLLAAGTVKDLPDLLKRKRLGQARIVELEITRAERLGRLIAALAPLFLIVGLLGVYIEIKTPGFGLPGIVGGLALAIFFWGHHVAGLAGFEDLIIFLAGIALILLEVFVLPGFGFAGVAGIILVCWSLLAAMAENLPGMPWYPTWDELRGPIIKLGFSLALAAVGAGALAKYLPRSRMFKRLALDAAVSSRAGYTAAPDKAPWVGRQGLAVTMLRPAGTGLFSGQRLDVVTGGDFIAAGQPIRIVEARGNRVVVAPDPAPETKRG